jgi:plasmid stabilization system protein ParE
VAKPVRTTPQADLHILELDAWWRENRDKAPDLFEQELSMTFRTIGSAPYAGKRYPHPDADVYRVLMRSTRNHVYYVERDDYVLVVAVWGAVKDAGPDLAGLTPGR